MYIYFIHMPCVSMRLLKTQLYKKKIKKKKERKRSTRWWGGGWNGNGSAAWRYVEWNRSLVWFTGFGFQKKKNERKKKKNRSVFSVCLVTLQLNGLLVLLIRSFKCFIKQAAAVVVRSFGLWRWRPGQVFIRKGFMISTSWIRGNSNVGSRMETAGEKKSGEGNKTIA